MRKWIFGIILIVILFLVGIFTLKGHYKKTEILIGNDYVYNYKQIINFNYCKGYHEAILYQEGDDTYYVAYYCDGRGYFIKHNGDFIRLDEALDLEIITVDEIRNSELMLRKK